MTIDVSKLDKSKEVIDIHPSNKYHIIWTFLVSKLVKSKLVNFFELANIPYISFTFEV